MQRSNSMKQEKDGGLRLPDVSTMPQLSLSTSNLMGASGAVSAGSYNLGSAPLSSASPQSASRLGSKLLSGSTSPLASTTVILRVLVTAMSITKTLRVQSTDTVWALKKQVLEKMNADVKGALNCGIFVPSTSKTKGHFLEDQKTLAAYALENNMQVEFTTRKRVLSSPPVDQDVLPNQKNQKKFMEELTKGNYEKVRDRVQRGFDPNFETESGETPLCVAAMQDDPEMISILLDHGASMDYRCSDALHGKSPFHVAIANNKVSAVRCMLVRGAWVDIPDALVLTPLYYAVSGGYSESVEKLLDLKADASYVDESGKTLLHTACLNDFGQVTALLIDFGRLNLEAVNVAGNTPLHLTATRNAVVSARKLLIRGADRNKTNKFGNTALQMAVLSGSNEVAELLRTFTDDQIIPPPPPYSPDSSPVLRKRSQIPSSPLAGSVDIFSEQTAIHSTPEGQIHLSAKRPGSHLASTGSLVSQTPPSARTRIPGPPPGPPPSRLLKQQDSIATPNNATSHLGPPSNSPLTTVFTSLSTTLPATDSPTITTQESCSSPPQPLRITPAQTRTASLANSIGSLSATDSPRDSTKSKLSGAIVRLREKTIQSARPFSIDSCTPASGGINRCNSEASLKPPARSSLSTSDDAAARHSSASERNAAPTVAVTRPGGVLERPLEAWTDNGDVGAMVDAIGRIKNLVKNGLHEHTETILSELEAVSTRCKKVELELEASVAKLVAVRGSDRDA